MVAVSGFCDLNEMWKNVSVEDLNDFLSSGCSMEDLELKTDDILLSLDSSWADIANEEDEEKEKSIKKANTEMGRKIFIGNVNIGNNQSSLDCFQLLGFIAQKYGKIECIRYNVSKRFCFIVFEDSTNVCECFKQLKQFDIRCKHIEYLSNIIHSTTNIKNTIEQNIPKSNFYCRWPKDFNTKRKYKKKRSSGK